MAETGRPGEFEAIARFFAPLAGRAQGALGLKDDAALLVPTPGCETVATVDAMVEGVHFVADDPPGDIARKLLRVNLSDLAAKGATPRWCLLTLSLGARHDTAWLEGFAAGLAADLAAYGIDLMGGDTTSTPGPLTLTLTALGELPAGTAVLRSGAAAGQDIWVTGTLGDAALALALMQGRAGGAALSDYPFLHERYRLPRPRTALGLHLRGVAAAMMDVSDGLAADLGHICDTSSVGAEVRFADLPLSDEAARLLAACPALAPSVAAGGDDYELLFTADPVRAAEIRALAADAATPVHPVGRIMPGAGVRVLDAGGAEMALDGGGWRHF
jgi:thiamine-monophosphate kinase